MRIKVGDPDSPSARIFLDGIEQKHCVMADSTLNYIRRYKMKGGKPVLDTKNDWTIETVFGSVVIEMEDQHA